MKTEKIETLNGFDTNNALSSSTNNSLSVVLPVIGNTIGSKKASPTITRSVDELLPFDELWDSCALAKPYRPVQFKSVFKPDFKNEETLGLATAEDSKEKQTEIDDFTPIINNSAEGVDENEDTVYSQEKTYSTGSELNKIFSELSQETKETQVPSLIQSESEVKPLESNTEPVVTEEVEVPQLITQTKSPISGSGGKRKSESGAVWKICLVTGLTALFVGLFIFGREMLPAYLVKYQVQQATGMSLEMSNVRQDYRAGITNIESINVYDSAQQLYFQTGHVAFSNLPYYSGDKQRLEWAVIENIRFVESPNIPFNVFEDAKSGDSNSFSNLIQNASREMTDAQLDLVVNNTVNELVEAYEKPLSQWEQTAQQISGQVKEIQDAQLNSSASSGQESASAESLCQQMDEITNNVKQQREQFNSKKETLLSNLSHSAENKNLEIPTVTEGSVSEFLFLQHGQEFVGQFLYDLRQICRWLPEDLETAMGPQNSLDPSVFSFRRVSSKEQLSVGQIRLTGETRFLNQTMPFSAVVTNYSTTPEGKPLTVDIAFGSDGAARLRIEAQRNNNETLLKVDYYNASNNLATQFGSDKSISLNSEGIQNENVFARTDTIQLTISQGKVQGEYAFVQKANVISLRLAGVSSSENTQKLQTVIGTTDKISMNAVFAGGFNSPRYQITSNMDFIGKPALQIAADEYFIRMNTYRNALYKKYEVAFGETEKRFDMRQDQLATNLRGNVLLLNQITGSELQLASDKVEQKNSVPENEDVLSLPNTEAPLDNTQNTESEVIAQSEELPFPDDSTVPLTAPVTTAIANQAIAQPEALPLTPPMVSEPALPSTQQASSEEIPAVDNAIPADEFPVIPLEEDTSLTPEQAENLEFPEFVEEETPVLQYSQKEQSANETSDIHSFLESEINMELPPLPEL